MLHFYAGCTDTALVRTVSNFESLGCGVQGVGASSSKAYPHRMVTTGIYELDTRRFDFIPSAEHSTSMEQLTYPSNLAEYQTWLLVPLVAALLYDRAANYNHKAVSVVLFGVRRRAHTVSGNVAQPVTARPCREKSFVEIVS